MFYVAVFSLFVAVIVILSTIVRSVRECSNSLDVLTSSVEKLRVDSAESMSDLAFSQDVIKVQLEEIKKAVYLS